VERVDLKFGQCFLQFSLKSFVFLIENRVLGRIFGPKRDEVTGNGESCTMGSFIINTRHQILLGTSNQGE
jgi:hypothetical protein